MDNVRDLMMVQISVLLVLVFSAIVSGKTTQEENNHLPIEILFNPLKSMEKLQGSKSDDIEKENEEFQLKIRSDDEEERKVDLIIAATKKVQSSENSVDKVSTKYTTEKNVADEKSYSNRKGDNIDTKNLQTSRQDSSSLYQPSEFSVFDPFASEQKTFPFSPLENLRHFEDNLQRVMLPRLQEQALSTLQYADNESPRMMISTRPMYSNGYAPVFQMNSQFQPDPKFAQGVMHQQNPPEVYYLGSPHPIPTPSPPMQKYPLPIEKPISNSVVNPYYDHMNPVFKPTYPDPQPQYSIREMSRDPRYNAESGLISLAPERQVLLHSSGKPEYNIQQNSQRPLMNTYTEHLPPRNNINVNHHSHLLAPQNQRIPASLNNPHLNSQHELKNVNDRNLYYTPITDDSPKYEQRYPNYPSREVRPNINQHLHRLKIIPNEERYEDIPLNSANKLPNLNRLQPQITHPPLTRQAPRYTIVPQHMLPKYLQTPVYDNPHSFENQMQTQPLDKVKLSQEPHTLNGRQYPLPRDHSRQGNKLEEPYISSIPPQHFSEVHRRHPQQKEYSEPSHYLETNDHQKDYSLPSSQNRHQDLHKEKSTSSHPTQYRNHQEDYLVPSNYAKSHEPELDNSPVPHHVESQEPRQDYSENSHHVQSKDSVLPEKYNRERENNQLPKRKRRKKYRPVDPDHDKIPQTRKAKNHRKNDFKESNDDLHSHSSHQYIIKIG